MNLEMLLIDLLSEKSDTDKCMFLVKSINQFITKPSDENKNKLVIILRAISITLEGLKGADVRKTVDAILQDHVEKKLSQLAKTN